MRFFNMLSALRLRRTCSFSLALLGALTLFFLQVPSTFAASLSTDPLVYAVVDMTYQSSHTCTIEHTINIRTTHPTTIKVSCPPGTIWRSLIIPRSQALAQHVAFVQLPTTHPSQAQLTQAQRQLELIRQNNLHQSLAINIRPFSTPCATEASNSLNWQDSKGFETIYSTVTYYMLPNPNCGTVSIEKSEMWVTPSWDSIPPGTCLCWIYDRYASSTYNVPGQPNVSNGGYFWHGINMSATRGYTFENWLWESADSAFFYNDILVN